MPHPVAQAVTFQQGVVTAVESESDIVFDPDTLNPHYSYEDEKDRVHNVWMLDGVTAYNQLRAAERAGVRGTALWRLGMEDPSIWDIWDATHPDDATRNKLQDIPPGYDLILEGDGDIWRITATPQERPADARLRLGERRVSTTKASRAIRSRGESSRWARRRTKSRSPFDDGPDPRWTPKILDILKQKHAPATFFVIGEPANQEASIVKREFAQGDEIGNHTFTHPEFDIISKTQLQLELNLTELLIESSLGVKTTLFRPPYGIDHQPETASEIQMLPIPQSMGYIIVGARIDPHDWGEAERWRSSSGRHDRPASACRYRSEQGQHHPDARRRRRPQPHRRGAAANHRRRCARRATSLFPCRICLGRRGREMMPPLSHQEWLLARADAFIFDVFRWFAGRHRFIFVAGILLVSGRALIIGLAGAGRKASARSPRIVRITSPESPC